MEKEGGQRIRFWKTGHKHLLNFLSVSGLGSDTGRTSPKTCSSTNMRAIPFTIDLRVKLFVSIEGQGNATKVALKWLGIGERRVLTDFSQASEFTPSRVGNTRPQFVSYGSRIRVSCVSCLSCVSVIFFNFFIPVLTFSQRERKQGDTKDGHVCFLPFLCFLCLF
jgi:hypothetical protein